MVTNAKKSADERKGRVKVGKLKLNKETIKDLTGSESRKIKGGQKPEKSPNACVVTIKGVNCG
jgi:hypothetical protein